MGRKRKENVGANWRNRLVCAALHFLQESGGSAHVSDVVAHLERHHKSDIPAQEKEGSLEWRLGMQLDAVRFVTAGFLRRSKGVWSITPLGVKELARGNDSITRKAYDAYAEYMRQKKESKVKREEASAGAKRAKKDESPEGEDEGESPSLEDFYAFSVNSITRHIENMDAFMFQNLVAALFSGMGYYVREVSQQNTADGGIDVIAYQGGDLLGAKTPRVRAQVKRQEGKTGRPDLQKLIGAMTPGDVGVFVSTGGFSSSGRDYAKQHQSQMELIDMPRFIELWISNYGALSDEDKSLLPLQPVFFLDEERAKRS